MCVYESVCECVRVSVLVLWVSWPIARPCLCVINVLLDENCIPKQEGAVGVEGALH